MCSVTPSPPQRPPEIVYPSFGLPGTADVAFSFSASSTLAMPLVFEPQSHFPNLKKRYRALADVDGEHSCLHKKKRRLRLFLITSRLSPEFSHPATNIVDRGNSRIAIWAKQKALGRNLLQKAAMLNSIRRRAATDHEASGTLGRSLVAQEREQKQLELARLEFIYGSHNFQTRPIARATQLVPQHQPKDIPRQGDAFTYSIAAATEAVIPPPARSGTSTYRSPNDSYTDSYFPANAQHSPRDHHPASPSPLGLSNYDALDLEDDFGDPYAHLDDDVDADEEGGVMHKNDEPYPLDESLVPWTTSFSAPTGTSGVLANVPPHGSDFSRLDNEDNDPITLYPDEHADEDVDMCPTGPVPMIDRAAAIPAISYEPTSGPQISCSPNFAAFVAVEGGLPLHGQSEDAKRSSMLGTKGTESIQKRKEEERGVLLQRLGL